MNALALALAVSLGAQPAKAPPKSEARPPAADRIRTEITAQVRAFLTAFAAKDAKKLLSLLEPGALVSGTDVSEVCEDLACTEKLLKDGFAVFDSATFDEPKAVHVQASDTLATAFFDVRMETLTGKEKRAATMRFATSWRPSPLGWRLVQLVRAVPTVERSAKEILKDNELR